MEDTGVDVISITRTLIGAWLVRFSKYTVVYIDHLFTKQKKKGNRFKNTVREKASNDYMGV